MKETWNIMRLTCTYLVSAPKCCAVWEAICETVEMKRLEKCFVCCVFVLFVVASKIVHCSPSDIHVRLEFYRPHERQVHYCSVIHIHECSNPLIPCQITMYWFLTAVLSSCVLLKPSGGLSRISFHIVHTV